MATKIEERKAKLVYDIAGSSIVRDSHPFMVKVRTKMGRVHIITFGGSLEVAQASRTRFVKEFYALKKAYVPRKKARSEDAKFLGNEE